MKCKNCGKEITKYCDKYLHIPGGSSFCYPKPPSLEKAEPDYRAEAATKKDLGSSLDSLVKSAQKLAEETATLKNLVYKEHGTESLRDKIISEINEYLYHLFLPIDINPKILVLGLRENEAIYGNIDPQYIRSQAIFEHPYYHLHVIKLLVLSYIGVAI
jgi:hypothetical protein